MKFIPDGWAILPESVGTPETLENFPFGEITVGNVDGVPTVKSWKPLPLPPDPPEPPVLPQPTPDEDRDAMLVDLDYRLTMLELGGTI